MKVDCEDTNHGLKSNDKDVLKIMKQLWMKQNPKGLI
jgi:hypothetical protein